MQSVAPQNRHIVSLTKAFLRVHWDQKRPILLGYSGGPDSKVLLYALLECGVKPSIAHVDHGWREESAHEAYLLKEEASRLGCPFFSTRLIPKEKSEDEARIGRYGFFSEVVSSHAALLLAHTADDLAETVLKRVLEGANLSSLGSMQEKSVQNGMTIWRPFLSIKRSEIISFLEERSLSAFIDSSNLDPKYLRVRMRQDIFPFLNEKFGKQIQDNLCLLSQRAHELKEYLDMKIGEVPIQKGPWGALVDLKGLKSIEKRYLLQKLTPLNRDQLETLLDWVEKGEKSKILELKMTKILVDETRVWLFPKSSKNLESEI